MSSSNHHHHGTPHLHHHLIIFLSLFSLCRCDSMIIPKFTVASTNYLPMQELVGIYMEESRASPLFYDTFFPVVYEVPGPTWNNTSLRLQLPKNQSFINSFCNDTLNGTDPMLAVLCPLTTKLNVLLDKFAEQMKVFETFNASVSKLDTSFTSCHEIKPHFTNHIIDELEIELYLVQVILDCPLSEVIHHRVDVAEPNNQTYSELLKLVMQNLFFSKFHMNTVSAKSIISNSILNLHSTQLFDFFLNSYHWSSSIGICNTQRIPRLLIPPETLKSTLEEIETKIADKDMMLTIPIADISNYYKLQIADCVMTPSNLFVVRILVPLTRKSQAYRMVTVKSIPFLNRDNVSTKSMICAHRAVEGSVVVQGTNSNSIIPVARMKCEESQLCGIPQPGDRPAFGKCLHSTLRNDSKGIVESCHMSCIPYDDLYLPYFKRIRSDQFVIVGRSSAEIAVVCKKTDPITVHSIPEHVGSMIVTLPCSCHLSHRNEKYEINGPCDFHLEFQPVRPKGWSNEALLAHFHHHTPSNGVSEPGKQGALYLNESNGDDVTEMDDDEDFNDVTVTHSATSYTAWHVYVAYVIIFLETVALVLGYYILRNVYARIGLVEISMAMSPNIQLQYTRNAPVEYHARGAMFPVSYSGSDSDTMY